MLSLIVLNLQSIYRLFSYSDQDYNLQADLYIAAKQISQELMLSTDIDVSDKLIFKDESLENINIYLDNHRIVKSPGFEIFAFEIDDLEFIEENNFIYMIVERDENEYKFLIGENFESLE